MAQVTLNNVRFAGLSTCVPRRVLNNLLDCPPSLSAERERIVRNIGIVNRRICPEWQCFSDLAFDASEKLLSDLNWEKDEVDALIVVTQSPDYLIPSTAIILQDRLGLKHSTIAYDINLGCSGYPFGLHLLACMIAGGGVKKGLLLVGDKSASVREPLFSDAGTATALEYCESAPAMHFDLNSDGSGYKAIMLPAGGHRQPFSARHIIPVIDEHGQHRWPGDLILDGTAVLNFSIGRIPPLVEHALNTAGLEKEQVDHYVFHQANRMINETIRKKLKLPEERVPSTLREFGNTSGASLPVTVTARLRESLQGGKRKILFAGFGIGLSWGTCIVDIENACFPELIES